MPSKFLDLNSFCSFFISKLIKKNKFSNLPLFLIFSINLELHVRKQFQIWAMGAILDNQLELSIQMRTILFKYRYFCQYYFNIIFV